MRKRPHANLLRSSMQRQLRKGHFGVSAGETSASQRAAAHVAVLAAKSIVSDAPPAAQACQPQHRRRPHTLLVQARRLLQQLPWQ
jgi:hypothetical protein